MFGVTVPGTLIILIGFNDSISWGVTNSPRDQVDWFSVTFKDDSRKEYLYTINSLKQNISSKKLQLKITKILLIPSSGYITDLSYDCHYLTNHAKANLAMRWISHDESTTFKALFQFNRANNYV